VDLEAMGALTRKLAFTLAITFSYPNKLSCLLFGCFQVSLSQHIKKWAEMRLGAPDCFSHLVVKAVGIAVCLSPTASAA